MLVSSEGVALGPVAAVQSGFDVRWRLARSGEIWAGWYLVWSWLPYLSVKGGSTMATQIMGCPARLSCSQAIAVLAAAERPAVGYGDDDAESRIMPTPMSDVLVGKRSAVGWSA
jgi:hypothetical protein